MTNLIMPLPCPICGAPPKERFRPFCSLRCANVDLGNWLTDRYAIPVAEDEQDPGTEEPRLAGQGREG